MHRFHRCRVSLIALLLVLLIALTAAKEEHKIKINAPASSPQHTPRTTTATTTIATNPDTPTTPTTQPTLLLPAITVSRPPAPSTLPASHPTAHSLLSLASTCYIHASEVGDGPAVTTIACPFHNITQHLATSPPSYHSLGVWSRWSSQSQPHELVQQFDDGDECSGGEAGRRRSTTLHVRCHVNNSVAAVVQLRRCQYKVVLYSAAACPHLPPSQPVVAAERSGRGSEARGQGESQQNEDAVDVTAMQACIRELSEANDSERSTVPCAVHWNELRAARLDEALQVQTDEIVEVHRVVYPYTHKKQPNSSFQPP